MPAGSQHYVLAKIGQSEFMQDLVENGTVFMRRLSTYKGLEDQVRGDKNEAVALRFDASNPNLRLSVTTGAKTMNLHGASLVIDSAEHDHGVYCMHAIPVPSENGAVRGEQVVLVAKDRRIREGFGDAFVGFRDPTEFVRRLTVAAQAAGYELKGDAIEYVPMDYCGYLGPFRKLEGYRYQSEYRFFTTTPIPGEWLVLTLGSLRDIAVLRDLSEVPLEPEVSGQL